MDWMGNRDWESFALSARESQTRTRDRVTTTTSSAWPAPRQPRNSRGTTQSRGTPMDAGDSRGTGVNITTVCTSCNNRYGAGGVAFAVAEKRGSGKVAKQKLSSWPLRLLDIISKSIHNYSCHPLETSMQMVRCLSARTIISSLASTGCQWKSFC